MGAADIAGNIGNILTGGLGEKIGNVVNQLVPDRDLNVKLKHELDMAKLVSQTDMEKAAIEAER